MSRSRIPYAIDEHRWLHMRKTSYIELLESLGKSRVEAESEASQLPTLMYEGVEKVILSRTKSTTWHWHRGSDFPFGLGSNGEEYGASRSRASTRGTSRSRASRRGASRSRSRSREIDVPPIPSRRYVTWPSLDNNTIALVSDV